MRIGWRRFLPLAAALLMLGLAAAWLASAQFYLIDRLQFNGSASTGPVSRGHDLIQTFKAPASSISRIDLTLTRKPGPGGQLRLELFEVRGDPAGAPVLGRKLAESVLDEQSFAYTDVRRFEFSPAPLTPGDTYAFRLSSGDSNQDAVVAGDSGADNYKEGRLFIDGSGTDADLYFALFHTAGVGGELDRIVPWRPWPFDSRILYAGLFLTGAAVFGWLLWQVAAAPAGVIPETGEAAPESDESKMS